MVSEDVKKRLPCSGALGRKDDRKVNNVGDMNRGEEAGLCSTGERERKRQDDLVFAEETAFSPGQEGRRPCVNNGKAQGERPSDSGNEAMWKREIQRHREGSAYASGQENARRLPSGGGRGSRTGGKKQERACEQGRKENTRTRKCFALLDSEAMRRRGVDTAGKGSARGHREGSAYAGGQENARRLPSGGGRGSRTG